MQDGCGEMVHMNVNREGQWTVKREKKEGSVVSKEISKNMVLKSAY